MPDAERHRRPVGARRARQRAAGLRRLVGRPGRHVRPAGGARPGPTDEPVRAPRRRRAFRWRSAPTHRSPRSTRGPPSGPARSTRSPTTGSARGRPSSRTPAVPGGPPGWTTAGVLAPGAPASYAIWAAGEPRRPGPRRPDPGLEHRPAVRHAGPAGPHAGPRPAAVPAHASWPAAHGAPGLTGSARSVRLDAGRPARTPGRGPGGQVRGPAPGQVRGVAQEATPGAVRRRS